MKIRLISTLIGLFIIQSIAAFGLFSKAEFFMAWFTNASYNLQDLIRVVLLATVEIISIILFILVINKAKHQEKIYIEAPVPSDNKKNKSNKAKKGNPQNTQKEIEQKQKVVLSNLMENLIEKQTLPEFSEKLLSNFAKEFEIVQGILYAKHTDEIFHNITSYAYYSEEEIRSFSNGEGIPGQVAENKELINIKNIPENYITVLSGLGQSAPLDLLIFPIIYNDKTIGIVELATFKKIDTFSEEVINNFSLKISEKFNNLLEIYRNEQKTT